MAQAAAAGNTSASRAQAALTFLRSQMTPSGLLDSYVEDGIDRSYTYDDALAAMAFIVAGDVHSARSILDAFQAIGPTKHGGFLEAYHAATGKPDGILVAGPNAYLLQAINLYYATTRDPRYDVLAKTLADYLLSLQDGDGGLFGRSGVTWKSTENNLGAYCAIRNMGILHGNPDYLEKAEKIHQFLVNKCWDGRRFLRGKNDPTVVTDVQALGALVLGLDFAQGVFWVKGATYVITRSPEGRSITGFDFDGDRDTIWTEGTLQQALAFLTTAADPQKGLYYKAEMEKLVRPSGALLLTPHSGTAGSGWTLQPWQAVAPTAWYLFLSFKTNPLQLLVHGQFMRKV